MRPSSKLGWKTSAPFLTLWLALAAAPNLAHAQANGALHAALGASDDWKISGSVRLRYEGIGDQFRPSPAPEQDELLSVRTTLFAQYGRGPVRVGGEVFDSRAFWEDQLSTAGSNEVNTLELVQAYVSVDLGRPSTTLTAGRFTMDEGSRRLVARNGFRNTTNSFTGVRLDWTSKGESARLFWTMPQYRRPDGIDDIRHDRIQLDRESTDVQLFGASYTRKAFGGTAQTYLYRLDEQDSLRVATRDRRLVTFGGRLFRAPKSGLYDWDLEAVYQTGEARATARATDVTDLDVSAHLVHLEVGRTLDGPSAQRWSVQADLASGDKGKPGKLGRFDTLFGARRGDFGPTSLWGPVQRANLRSVGARYEVTPDPRWDFMVAARGLWLDQPRDSFALTGVRDPSGRSGRYAGVQAETRVRYWLKPKTLRLEGGAAWLAKGSFLQDAPNAPPTGNARYGYMELNYTF